MLVLIGIMKKSQYEIQLTGVIFTFNNGDSITPSPNLLTFGLLYEFIIMDYLHYNIKNNNKNSIMATWYHWYYYLQQ